MRNWRFSNAFWVPLESQEEGKGQKEFVNSGFSEGNCTIGVLDS